MHRPRRPIEVSLAQICGRVVKIYWPVSEQTQQFRDIAADQWLEITEGQDDYRKLDHEPVPFGG